MPATEFVTGGGVRVSRTAEPFDPALLDEVTRQVGERRGGVLSSGMEYPGRYSRWHLAYVDPPVEIVARGRLVIARALNERGRVLLPVAAAALRRAGRDTGRAGLGPDEAEVVVTDAGRAFTEEERSRRPTVFSALREVIAAFAGPDPHLGLYGAFGYDLAFQFEPVAQRAARDAAARDLVLHLPDRLYVLDRKRETAICYRYEFATDAGATDGLPRSAEAGPAGAAAGGRPLLMMAFPACRPARSQARTRPWCSRPGSGSPAATCSRSCRVTYSTPAARRRPRSSNGCASATRPRTSSSGTWVSRSTWSGRRRRCMCG